MAARGQSGFQAAFWGAKRAMKGAHDEAFARHGVRDGQQFILRCLWEEDGLAPGEIAKRLGLSTPTVTKAATRMEAAGILERRAHGQDARLVRLCLTKRGRALERLLTQETDRVTEAALEGIGAADRKRLIQLLRQVRANLTGEAPDRGEAGEA